MENIEHLKIQELVEELAVFGGEYTLSQHEHVLVGTKGGDYRNVVTNIDIETENQIRAKITAMYPEHGFHLEESEDKDLSAEYVWSIDPIDGTSNYIRNIPHYSCCISVLQSGRVIASAIYNPVTHDCFTYKNETAYLNGKKLKVSDITHVKDAYFIFHPGRKVEMRIWAGETLIDLLTRAKKNINLASSALDLCFLADNRVDAVIYGTFSTLDIAGAVAIVRAAGGEVYDYDSKIPVVFSTEPHKIIATATPELLEDFFTQH